MSEECEAASYSDTSSPISIEGSELLISIEGYSNVLELLKLQPVIVAATAGLPQFRRRRCPIMTHRHHQHLSS